MKLHKDGTLEGTPQEIAEYTRVTAPKIGEKPFDIRDTGTVPWITRQTPDTLIPRVTGTTSNSGKTTPTTVAANPFVMSEFLMQGENGAAIPVDEWIKMQFRC